MSRPMSAPINLAGISVPAHHHAHAARVSGEASWRFVRSINGITTLGGLVSAAPAGGLCAMVYKRGSYGLPGFSRGASQEAFGLQRP